MNVNKNYRAKEKSTLFVNFLLFSQPSYSIFLTFNGLNYLFEEKIDRDMLGEGKTKTP